MTTKTDFEAVARQLKAEGYTGGVVARKLISQHGMVETDAVALVGQLYGRPVDPRGGQTLTGLATGAALVAVGLAGVAAMYALDSVSFQLGLALLGVTGAGATRVVISLVNHGTTPPLKEPD